MSQINTVAVLGEKDIQADIRGAFPAFRVIGLSVFENARRLIREGSIGLFFAQVNHPRAGDVEKFRTLAREATRQEIPALFITDSRDAYSLILNAVGAAPIVGVALGRSEVRPLVNMLRDRASRVGSVGKGASSAADQRLDLDEHPLLQASTSFLRNPDSGRLDAKLIAELFGEPLARFAEALGVSPAAVSQTPDSKRYQEFLSTFERVARIIPMLDSKESFNAWVRTPNKELKGAAPIEWLFGGPKPAHRLAEIVEDVLVGQPD